MKNKGRSNAVLPSTDSGGSTGRVHELSGLESGVTLCSGNILRGALLQQLSQISVVEVPLDPNKVSRSVIESQRGSDVIEAHSSPSSHTDPAAAASGSADLSNLPNHQNSNTPPKSQSCSSQMSQTCAFIVTLMRPVQCSNEWQGI